MLSLPLTSCLLDQIFLHCTSAHDRALLASQANLEFLALNSDHLTGSGIVALTNRLDSSGSIVSLSQRNPSRLFSLIYLIRLASRTKH